MDAATKELMDLAKKDYLEMLSNDLPLLGSLIKAWYDEHDRSALTQALEISHRIRGSAGCYGYNALGTAAGLIEDRLTLESVCNRSFEFTVEPDFASRERNQSVSQIRHRMNS